MSNVNYTIDYRTAYFMMGFLADYIFNREGVTDLSIIEKEVQDYLIDYCNDMNISVIEIKDKEEFEKMVRKYQAKFVNLE